MSKMASQAKVLPPIIQDEMQKRRMMKRATTVAKFQTRVFVLYKHQLVYKTKDGKQIRGSVSVLGIKICEDVEDCAFNRPHVFQVGYLEKGKMFHLYIQAKDHEMREHWKFHIRKLCSTYNDHRMQEQYHPGHYKKDRWSCCVNDDKNNIGCRQAYRYSDPQPLGASSSTALTLPLTNYRHKTPVLRRTEPINRVKMPSDCYDSDEIEDALKSPSPSPRYPDLNLVGSPERKSKTPLSSSSMRYTSRYAAGRQGSSISGTSESAPDVGLSMSTPYYCPINTVPIKELGHSYSISSTRADAGSDRLDSVGAMSHTSRLDSQGSTIGSSFCESIPRTESDYQSRIEEEGEGCTGPVYTNSRISKLRRSGNSIERDQIGSPDGTLPLDFELDLNDERSQSGTYVNTHTRYA